jgi:hypothetical protein
MLLNDLCTTDYSSWQVLIGISRICLLALLYSRTVIYPNFVMVVIYNCFRAVSTWLLMFAIASFF